LLVNLINFKTDKDQFVVLSIVKSDNPGNWPASTTTDLTDFVWGCTLYTKTNALSGAATVLLSLWLTLLLSHCLSLSFAHHLCECFALFFSVCVAVSCFRCCNASALPLPEMKRCLCRCCCRCRRRCRRWGLPGVPEVLLLLKILRNSRESFSRYQTSESSSRCVLFLSRAKVA